MRKLMCAAFVVFAAVLAPAQSFECQPAGLFQTECCSDCEDAWSNNAGLGTGITGAPVCGMPAGGNQYGRLTASGAYPGGFPLARPIPFEVSELRVNVPEGAAGVSFKANWFNAEHGPSFLANDGLEISIIAPDGVTMLVPIAYVDTFTPLAPGLCVDPLSGGEDVLSDGVESVSVTFPPLPFGCYLSFVCFNGGDTERPSSLLVDCIAWGDPAVPSFERGDGAGPRVLDLTPTLSYRVGLPTTVALFAGPLYADGQHVLGIQLADFSTPPQFITPGIAGALFLRPRETGILSEGLLTFEGAGPVISFTVTDPILGGVGFVMQGLVFDSTGSNPAWTTGLFGWFR
jgi:hypothetical protein